jgi:hypothetical protein
MAQHSMKKPDRISFEIRELLIRENKKVAFLSKDLLLKLSGRKKLETSFITSLYQEGLKIKTLILFHNNEFFASLMYTADYLKVDPVYCSDID